MGFAAAGASAGIAALIASLSVTAVGVAFGTWQAVEARNRQAAEAEAVQRENEKQAVAAQQTAAFAEQQHRRRMALLAGRQQAVTAAAGVSTTSGSPLVAEIDLNTQSELEALQIRRGGQIESDAKTWEARLANYRAATAKGAVPYDIASGALSLANSYTSAYSNYEGYNRYYGSKNRAFTSMG